LRFAKCRTRQVAAARLRLAAIACERGAVVPVELLMPVLAKQTVVLQAIKDLQDAGRGSGSSREALLLALYDVD
jgi:hypothetical protein